MRAGRANRGRKAACALAAIAALTALPAATTAGERRITIREARPAARAAVVEHATYRSIRSASNLVTRACWRSRRAVRCSLYRWASDPCALDGRDGICAQVMTRRTWLVEVRRRNGRVIARVQRVTDTSAAVQEDTSARSSS